MKLKHTKVATLAATLTFGSLAGVANAATFRFTIEGVATDVPSDATQLSIGDSATLSYVFETSTIPSSGTSPLAVNGILSEAAVSTDFGDFSIPLGDAGLFFQDNSSLTLQFSQGGFTGAQLFDGRLLIDSVAFVGFSGLDFGDLRDSFEAALPSLTTANLSSNFVLVLADSSTFQNDEAVFTPTSLTVTQIPEPSSALLLGLGALGLISRRKRESLPRLETTRNWT